MNEAQVTIPKKPVRHRGHPKGEQQQWGVCPACDKAILTALRRNKPRYTPRKEN